MNNIFGLTRILLGLAAFFYFLAFGFAFWFWVKGIAYKKNIFTGIIGSAFLLHTIALLARGFSSGFYLPTHNFFELLQLTNWGLVSLVLIFDFTLRSPCLSGITAGVCGFMGSLAFTFKSWDTTSKPYCDLDLGIMAHVLLAILTYAILGIVSVLSFIYLLQDFSLRRKRYERFFAVLPSLWELNRLIVRFMGMAVVMITSTLIIGIIEWITFYPTISYEKLFYSTLLWGGYTVCWLLQYSNRLSARWFSSLCCIFFIIALFILWPFNQKTFIQD